MAISGVSNLDSAKIMIDIPQRQTGAVIEVTPEMIVRGVDEMCVYDWERDDPSAVVLRIIKAVLEPDAVTFHEIKKVGS